MANTSDKVKEGIHDAAEKVKDAEHNVAEKTKDVAHNVGEKVKDAAHNVAEKTKDVVHNVGEKIRDAGRGTPVHSKIRGRPASAAGRPPSGEDRTDPWRKKSQDISLAFLFQRRTMKVVTEPVWPHLRLRSKSESKLSDD